MTDFTRGRGTQHAVEEVTRVEIGTVLSRTMEKLEWGARGEFAAHVLPKECRFLLDHIRGLGPSADDRHGPGTLTMPNLEAEKPRYLIACSNTWYHDPHDYTVSSGAVYSCKGVPFLRHTDNVQPAESGWPYLLPVGVVAALLGIALSRK